MAGAEPARPDAGPRARARRGLAVQLRRPPPVRYPLGVDNPSEADPYLLALPEQERPGQVVVVLGTQGLELRRRVLSGAAILMAGFLPLVALLAWCVSEGPSRRLHTVSRAVERSADGELSLRLPVQSSAELGQLVRNINRLAAALQDGREALEERIRAATADLTA